MSFYSFGGDLGGALADEHAKKEFFEANPSAYHPRWGWKEGYFKNMRDQAIAATLKRGMMGAVRAEYLQSIQEAMYADWDKADAMRAAEAAEAAEAVAAVTAGVQAEEEEEDEDPPALAWSEALEVLRPHLKEEFEDKRFECGRVLCAWSAVGCANLKRRMGCDAWDPVARTFKLPDAQQGKAKCKGYQNGFQGVLEHAKICAAAEMTEEEEDNYFETNGKDPDQDCARLHRLLAEVLESLSANPVRGR